MDSTSVTHCAALSPGDLLDEKEVAALLGVKIQTLRNWRAARRGGPPFRKIGLRMVRYHRADVDAFVAGCTEQVAA